MNDYEIKKLYEEMELHLVQSMKRNLGRHLTEEKEVGFKFTQWQAEKLKELKRYQRENKKIIGRYTLGLDKEVSEHLQNELKQGSINAIRQYNQALGKSLKPDKVMNKSFFKTNDKKVNNLIKVVNNDLKTANTSALRMINDQYRQIIHKSAFFVGNGVFTEKQAAAQAVKEISQKKLTTLAVDEASKNFLAGGLNCIEYSDGRRVNIASYSQMAIRTASIRSQLMGEGDFRKSIGRTLVKVTTHGGACPLCVKWQGQILIDDVYSGGTSKDGKYTLLSTAMKQGFLHPNCRHGITTYYPELEDDEASAETLQTSAEQEETQQKFNYAVRNVKKYRRLERGSLAKENINQYSNKKIEWIDEAEKYKKQLVLSSKKEPHFDTVYDAVRNLYNYADEVAIRGINNLDNLNEVNKTLDRLKRKYPTTNLDIIELTTKRDAMASASYRTLSLKKSEFNKKSFEFVDYKQEKTGLLNEVNERLKELDVKREEWIKQHLDVQKYEKSLLKAKEKLEYSLKFNRFGVDYEDLHIRAVITHEYGHVIADQYIGQINKWNANPKFDYNSNNKLYQLNQKVEKTYRQAIENNDIYNISKYAAKNSHEFFAETFAIYDIGREKLPKYIVEMLEEVIEYGKKSM